MAGALASRVNSTGGRSFSAGAARASSASSSLCAAVVNRAAASWPPASWVRAARVPYSLTRFDTTRATTHSICGNAASNARSAADRRSPSDAMEGSVDSR